MTAKSLADVARQKASLYLIEHVLPELRDPDATDLGEMQAALMSLIIEAYDEGGNEPCGIGKWGCK